MRRVALLFILVAALYACVGDDPGTGGSPTGTDAGTSASSSSSGSASSSSGSASSSGTPPMCGVPGTPCCAGVCEGGAECRSDACSCVAPKAACGNVCVDTKTDPAHCGACGHGCAGGACTSGVCQPITVTAGQATTRTLIVEGDRAYLTHAGSAQVKGGLYSVKLDGTELRPHVEYDLGAGRCTGLAIAKGKAYFLCGTDGAKQLQSCDLPDCASPGGPLPALVKGGLPGNATLVAADKGSGKVYYGVATTYNQSTGGGIFDSTGVLVSAANQPDPGGLAAANGAVLWLNQGTYTSDVAQKNGGVKRVGIAPASAEALVLGTSGRYFDNSGFAVDSTNAYYAGRNSVTGKTDIVYGPLGGGGSVTVLAADFTTASIPLAADGDNVYFSDGTRMLWCSRTAGCGVSPKVLAPSEPDVDVITTDATSVLWVRGSGELRRIARPLP